MMTRHIDNKTYIRYPRALAIAFQVLKEDKHLHFADLSTLSYRMGTENNLMTLQVLNDLCVRYDLRYSLDDNGVTLRNNNLKID